MSIGARAAGGVADRPAERREGLFPLTARWFWVWLAARVGVFLILAHWYDLFVFREISSRLASGGGVYAISHLWLAEVGEGYYVYPPLYAYALALAGRLAALLGGGWYVHALAIKAVLVVGDLATFGVLRGVNPQAARLYWTLWFVPLLAIAQIQPDIWVGVTLLLAYLAAGRARWALAGVLVGVGAAIKFTPAVTVPFVLVYLWHRGSRRSAAAFAAAAAGAFIAAWLPYLMLYPDAWQFGQVLAFHQARLGGGLTVITPLTVLRAVNDQLGGLSAISDALTILVQRVSVAWVAVTAALMLTLLVRAGRHRWTLEHTFLLPMIGFLASSKLVNEQYLLQILPLALIVTPAFLPSVFWPFSIYVLAAGTPLRFLPREINPVDFASPTWAPRALEGLLLVLTVLMAGAAAVVSFRLGAMAFSGERRRAKRIRPLLRYAPLALAVLAVVALLAAQRPRAGALELTAAPEAQDLTGTGAVSLIRVHVRNRSADALALRFTVGVQEKESVWVPVSAPDPFTVEEDEGRALLLQPREFDRAVPLGVPFVVRAVAPAQDLAAEAAVAGPAAVPWTAAWRIPGADLARPSGRIALSRGVHERAGMGLRCLDGRMGLRMTVRRTPASASEWTVAEIQHQLDAPAVAALMAHGVEVWVFRPLDYTHQAGWPTAAQSREFRGPGGAALTIAFSSAGEALYDLSPTRRVLVLHVPDRGWTRLHIWIGEDAREVGLRPGQPWTLAVSTAAQRQKPGAYEGTFGLVDPAGRMLPCEGEGGK